MQYEPLVIEETVAIELKQKYHPNAIFAPRHAYKSRTGNSHGFDNRMRNKSKPAAEGKISNSKVGH